MFVNLKTNFEYIDNFFISTHPDDVSKKNNKINYHFLPTPVDKNIEKLNIYNLNNYTYDVFFALSHGVNRGIIKSGKKDEREDPHRADGAGYIAKACRRCPAASARCGKRRIGC